MAPPDPLVVEQYAKVLRPAPGEEFEVNPPQSYVACYDLHICVAEGKTKWTSSTKIL